LRKEGRGRGTLLARAEAAEVLGRLGHDVGAERHLDAPRRLAADGHVEEDLWYCDGFFRAAVAAVFLPACVFESSRLVAGRLGAAARVRVRASRARARCLLVFSSARAARSNFLQRAARQGRCGRCWDAAACNRVSHGEYSGWRLIDEFLGPHESGYGLPGTSRRS